MTAIYLIAFCTGNYLIYLVLPRLLYAATLFTVTIGYMGFAYRHYFDGGWEASGRTTPFNEEFIFSMILLATLFSSCGFAAWLLHHRWKPCGGGFRAKLTTFGIMGLACGLGTVGLVYGAPLSFDMPIDLTLCETARQRPSYCQ